MITLHKLESESTCTLEFETPAMLWSSKKVSELIEFASLYCTSAGIILILVSDTRWLCTTMHFTVKAKENEFFLAYELKDAIAAMCVLEED